jgi:predicted lipoprotein with Yx(FWY)xxD motif
MLTHIGLPLAATALVAAACSSGSSYSSHQGSSSGGNAAAPKPATASITVKSVNGPLGSYLADGSGRALYLFASDRAKTSTCKGDCAEDWPPLTVDGSVTVAGGASHSDVATITRSDGAKQVTYAGHPLYYFAGDSGAGQTAGQGVDEFGALWWLVAPSGEKITS